MISLSWLPLYHHSDSRQPSSCGAECRNPQKDVVCLFSWVGENAAHHPTSSWLYEILRAAVTKCHKLGGFKQQKRVVSQLSGGKKSKIKVSSDLCTLWNLSGRILPPLPASGGGCQSFCFLDPWLALQRFSASHVQYLFSSSSKDNSHVELGGHLSPVGLCLNLTNCICNDPMSNKVTFQGSGC